MSLNIKNQTTTSWELRQSQGRVIQQTFKAPKSINFDTNTGILLGIISCLEKLKRTTIIPRSITIFTCQKLKINNQQNNRYYSYWQKLQEDFNLSYHVIKKCNNCMKTLMENSTMYSVYGTPLQQLKLPGGSPILKINEIELLGDPTTNILNEQHSIQVKTFMTAKYAWHQSQFNEIDWDLHEDMLVKTKHLRTFNIKFVGHWLPVYSHPSNSESTQICIRCNIDIETQDHWYTCSCKEAISEREKFQTQSISFLRNTGLHPELQKLVLSQLYSTPYEPPDYLMSTYKKQSSIGWGHFLRGRLIKEWMSLQNKLTSQEDGSKQWLKTIIHINIVLHELWRLRNQAIHSNNESHVQRRLEFLVTPQVTRLYDLQDKLSEFDRKVFTMPQNELLGQPIQVIEKWIERNKKFIETMAKHETTRIAEQNHPITKFFHTLTPSKCRKRSDQETNQTTQETTHDRNSKLLKQKQLGIRKFTCKHTAGNTNTTEK
jgi:hypothetical protein